MDVGKIMITENPKKEIQFWLDALANPNVNKESIEKLNKGLQMELNKQLYPVVVFKEF